MSKYLYVAIAAAAYWAWANRAAVASLIRARVTPSQTNDADTTQRRVQTLLALKTELEAEGKPEIAGLIREILWRILGGKPHGM